MTIRKATQNDIQAIATIYDLLHTEEEQGKNTIGWIRGVYPTRQTAEQALREDDLFVLEDQDKVIAAARINQAQDPAYRDAKWTYPAPDSEVMVLHTLVVDPRMKGHGYGKAFVAFYEQYARTHRCPVLRMDTNARNRAARALYAHLGYHEAGIVPCVFNGIPNVQLVCLEKQLS